MAVAVEEELRGGGQRLAALVTAFVWDFLVGYFDLTDGQ